MRSCLLSAFLLVSLSGCATMIHGSTQEVGIFSSPPGARVMLDSLPIGRTPLVVDLQRGSRHVLTLHLSGHEPFVTELAPSTSGWAWGNLVSLGPLGLAIDALSGALYHLSPEHVAAELRPEGGDVPAVFRYPPGGPR